MITLKIDKKQHDNNIRLTWRDSGSNNYTYRVFRRKVSNSLGSNEIKEDYKPICVFDADNDKDTVKVLNIHPNCGNEVTFTDFVGETRTIRQSEMLQKWLLEPTQEAELGYGIGKIDITSCPVSQFNENPRGKLFHSNGVAKYDVVCVGFFDAANRGNENEQFSSQSREVLREYIEDGYGVLTGHDYIDGVFGTYQGLGPIRDLFDITLGQWGTNTGTGFDHAIRAKFEGDVLEVKKAGSVMLYPWAIGTLGDEINISKTHTGAQFAHADIWLSFKNPVITGEEYMSPNQKKIGNFYLTTYKSTAMIQIGHTLDIQDVERKILANTIFALKQKTANTTFIDNKGIDDEKPLSPTIVNHYIDKNDFIATFDYRSEDVGVALEYYVEGINKKTGAREISNIVEAKYIAGLDYYKYKLERITSDTPDARKSAEWIKTKDRLISSDELMKGYYSFQLYAVDKNLNKSDIKEIIFYMPGKVIREKSPATTKYPNVQRVNNRYRGPHESRKANDTVAQVMYNLNNIKKIVTDLEKEKAIMLERPNASYVEISEKSLVTRGTVNFIRRNRTNIDKDGFTIEVEELRLVDENGLELKEIRLQIPIE